MSGLAQGDGLAQPRFEIGGVAGFEPGDQRLVVVERLAGLLALAPGVGQAQKRAFSEGLVADLVKGSLVGVAGLAVEAQAVEVVGAVEAGAVGLRGGGEAPGERFKAHFGGLAIAEKEADATPQQQGAGRLGRGRVGGDDLAEQLLGLFGAAGGKAQARESVAGRVYLRCGGIVGEQAPVDGDGLPQVLALGIIGRCVEQGGRREIAGAKTALDLLVGPRRRQKLALLRKASGPLAARIGSTEVVGVFEVELLVGGNRQIAAAVEAIGARQHQPGFGQLRAAGVVADIFGKERRSGGVVARIPE